MLYRALRRIYEKQTADGPFMSGICEHLLRCEWLSEKQKEVSRAKLRKYNRQLTRIANEIEKSKAEL